MQKPERCAKHSSLFRPQDAVAVFAPAPLRLFLPQAAPQLRSPPPFICSPGPAGPILLRLANFPGGRRCALVKIGALRQLRLAASAAGSARLSCPLSGGSGPLTASFTAAPPGGLFAQNFAAHRQDLDSHPPAHRGVPLSLRDIPLRGISAVTSPSPSSFAGIVKCKAL